MKYFSTFSGIGGFEIPLEEKGFECVGYSEIDKYAIQVYEKHFKHKNFGDITQIDIPSLPDFDLLVGGSPCQDLSVAKKNREGLSGSRSGLFYKFAEILKVKKPKYFILENVASMSKESRNQITEILGVEPVMINASLVSAQNRKRLFWANFPITQPEDRGIVLKDILETGDTDRLKSYCIDANYWKGSSFKHYQEKGTRQLVFTQRVGQIGKGGQGDRIYSVLGKSVNLSANGGGRGAKTGLYLIEPVNLTERRTELGKQLRRENRKKYGYDYDPRTNRELVPRSDHKVGTLLGGINKESFIAYQNIVRKLTPIECARLQCFPDNWCEDLSNTQQYKCYGNAVNVEVVRQIVDCLCRKII